MQGMSIAVNILEIVFYIAIIIVLARRLKK